MARVLLGCSHPTLVASAARPSRGQEYTKRAWTSAGSWKGGIAASPTDTDKRNAIKKADAPVKQVVDIHRCQPFLRSSLIGANFVRFFFYYGNRIPWERKPALVALARICNSSGPSASAKDDFDSLGTPLAYSITDDDLFIIPVDAAEVPITRWRVDNIPPVIANWRFGPAPELSLVAKELHGRELIFRNEKRPVCRFMDFHFVMGMIRIKDLNRPGWQDTWARYYEQGPFPTPRKYMRKSMVLALATHYGTMDMGVVDSWLVKHGFDSPLTLTTLPLKTTTKSIRLTVSPLTDTTQLRPEHGHCHYGRGHLEEEEEEEDAAGVGEEMTVSSRYAACYIVRSYIRHDDGGSRVKQPGRNNRVASEDGFITAT